MVPSGGETSSLTSWFTHEVDRCRLVQVLVANLLQYCRCKEANISAVHEIMSTGEVAHPCDVEKPMVCQRLYCQTL